MSEPYIGEIRMFGGNFAPRNWALCNGQLLAISSNQALFSILGTTYGGNGTTNFALPDLRGRVPVHQGQGPGLSPYVLGEVDGTENTNILTSQLPAHTHSLTQVQVQDSASTELGLHDHPSTTTILGSVKDINGNPVNVYVDVADHPANTLLPKATVTGTTDATGGSQPVSIVQPYLCVSFIIALFGIFPSRN